MAGFIPPLVIGIGRAVMGTIAKKPVMSARVIGAAAKGQIRSQTQNIAGAKPRVPDAIGPKPTKPNARRTGKTIGTKIGLGMITGPDMANFSTKVLGANHEVTKMHRHKAVKAREMYKDITAPLGNRPKKPST